MAQRVLGSPVPHYLHLVVIDPHPSSGVGLRAEDRFRQFLRHGLEARAAVGAAATVRGRLDRDDGEGRVGRVLDEEDAPHGTVEMETQLVAGQKDVPAHQVLQLGRTGEKGDGVGVDAELGGSVQLVVRAVHGGEGRLGDLREVGSGGPGHCGAGDAGGDVGGGSVEMIGVGVEALRIYEFAFVVDGGRSAQIFAYLGKIAVETRLE
ncbi:MAG: hypothetical protein L6R37_000713 [Teloschistes peruensis]|nr:MAG: hypothetical protein L6R37_000713 [Teloschistes peruensis]